MLKSGALKGEDESLSENLSDLAAVAVSKLFNLEFSVPFDTHSRERFGVNLVQGGMLEESFIVRVLSILEFLGF